MHTPERRLSLVELSVGAAGGSASLLFDSLLEQAPAGCLLVDRRGVLHRANAAAREMLGLPESRRTRPVLAAFIVPRQICEFYRFIRAAAISPKPTVMELQLRRLGDEPFWVRFDGRQVSTEEIPQGVLLSLVDISDRRRSEEQHRSSEARLRAVLESLPDAVFVVRRGQVVYVNPSGAHFLGQETDALVGRQFADFVIDPRDKLLCALSVDRFNEAVGPLEFRFVSGPQRANHVSAETLWTSIDFDGDSCTLCVLRDQTEKKRLQAHLSQNDRLASVGVLAAGVAHEINNPLAYVMMSLDELLAELRGALGPIGRVEDGRFLQTRPLENLAEQALDGTRRVAKIVEELRSFARDDETTIPVDVNRVVRKALNLAAPKTRHLVEVRADLGHIPAVEANEGRLVQVILNLVVNATQAISHEHSAGKVEVKTEAIGDEVVITIDDNGCGIPPEVRERIFEPFVTTKGVGEGSGLGLFVCHKYVTEYRGHIDIETETARGTRVVVKMPGIQGPAIPTSVVPKAIHSAPPRTERSIYIIDDEEPIRRVLTAALTRIGRVHAMESIDEVLTLLQQGSEPDLILCDLHLPGRTGAELYHWIMANRPRLASRIVMMTGGACTPKTQEFLRVARPRLLRKPFSLQELHAYLVPFLAPASNEDEY